jgi:hypothetical protein
MNYFFLALTRTVLAGIQTGVVFLLDCRNISSSRIVLTGADHHVLLCVYNRRRKLPWAGAQGMCWL